MKPPAAGASRTDSLRFIRDLQIRVALVLVPFEVLLIALAPPTWALVISLAAFALLVLDAIYLTAKIRRAESASP